MKKLLIILALFAGCEGVDTDGPDAQGYRWERTGTYVTLERRTVTVITDGNIPIHCGIEWHAQSCAVTREGDCSIFLPAGYPQWMLAHEHRHCDGWRHPNSLRAG